MNAVGHFDIVGNVLDRFTRDILPNIKMQMPTAPQFLRAWQTFNTSLPKQIALANKTQNMELGVGTEPSWPATLIEQAQSEILPDFEAVGQEAMEIGRTINNINTSDQSPGTFQSTENTMEACIDWFCLSRAFLGNIPATQNLYKPLMHAGEIRVLHLKSGLADEPLVCSLRHVQLQDPQLRFEALSYCWGNEKSINSLDCDGTRQHIQFSLDTALRRLRLPNNTRIIWADAICINQNDPKEKGHQIQLMRQIYKRATRVIVSIDGYNTLYSSPAFQLVSDVVAHWLESRASTPSPRQHTFGHGMELSAHRWDSLIHLFSHAYWKRLWIVQEVVSSERAIVHWGHDKIAWTLIGLASTIIRNNGRLFAQFVRRSRAIGLSGAKEGLLNAYIIHRLSQADFDAPSLSFLDLIRLTLNFQVSHPLDRIYAILGLPCQYTGSDSYPFVRSDYMLTKERLYVIVALQILESHESPLDLLSAVYHAPKAVTCSILPNYKAIDTTFPSWVPRWDLKPNRSICGSHRPAQRFNASSGYDTGISFSLVRRVISPILLVSGIVLDTLSESFESSLLRPPNHLNPGLLKWFLEHGSNDAELLACTITACQDWYGRTLRTDADISSHIADFYALHRFHRSYFRWKAVRSNSLVTHGDRTNRTNRTIPVGGNGFRFLDATRNVCRDRTVHYSEGGLFALGSSLARKGDLLCIIFGASIPFILRPSSKGAYQLVGECYVHGCMFGESVSNWLSGKNPYNQRHHYRDFKLL